MLVSRQRLSVDRWRIRLQPSQIYLHISTRARGFIWGVIDQRGFVEQQSHKRKLVTARHLWGGYESRLLRWGQQGTWLLCLRVLLAAPRAGCLLKMNAPSTANDDSFAVNHFQKWIATVFLEWALWNPSLIMAGFQLVVLSEISQDQNETSSLKRKKVLSIQKAKVFPASSRRAVTEDFSVPV